MKQVVFNSSQRVEVVEAARPSCGPKEVVVQVFASLISTGTETRGYDAGSLLARGLKNPSQIKTVWEMIEKEGVASAYRKIKSKKNELRPTGYSGAGVVVATGTLVEEFTVGDRVAYMGAPHAEYVCVGENLLSKIPAGVDFSQAAYGALACIAMNGVRLGLPTLGETAVVVGLGLVGLLTAQFAKLSGLNVLCLEVNPTRRKVAQLLGLNQVLDPTLEENIARTVFQWSSGVGADVVFLCAATQDSHVTNTILACCRDRARVVMIGDMGLDLDRGVLFSKELDFKVSRSYGPGRYDPDYEERGRDYPLGYVRWTQKRNLTCFLDLMAKGRIDLKSITTAEVPLAEAPRAYQMLSEANATQIGVLLVSKKNEETAPSPTPPVTALSRLPRQGPLRVGVVGCGAFVTNNLLPNFHKLNARLYGVANRTSKEFSKMKALYAPSLLTTSFEELLADENVDAFIIASPHNQHAEQALQVLSRKKPVYVEKPLALTREQVQRIASSVEETHGLLTVGYNRRFAPSVGALREILSHCPAPRQFLYRVNTASAPQNHWLSDLDVSGGKLVGEGCHFIDLVCHLAGAPVADVTGQFMSGGGPNVTAKDNFALTMKFLNGDLGTVFYTSVGNESASKERLEVFAGGKMCVIENFMGPVCFGFKGLHPPTTKLDRGYFYALKNFFDAVEGKGSLLTTVKDALVVADVIDRFSESLVPLR